MPKISALPVGVPADADEVPVNQAGTTRKVTAIGVADRKTWANLAGIPATFPPEVHSHAQADVTDLVATLARLPLIVRKTSDQSVTSNIVSADVADLGFSVAANTTYLIRYVMRFNSAATTTGVTWGLAGPASPTALMGGVFFHHNTALITRAVGVYSDVIFQGTEITSSPNGFMFLWEIMLLNGANAGVIVPRIRSEVSGSAVTVFANSFGMRWQLT